MDRLAVLKRARTNLESKNPGVRIVAIRVLKKLGNSEVILYLNKMLEDPDFQVRRKAAEVIHELVDFSVKKREGSDLNMNLIKMNKMLDKAEAGTVNIRKKANRKYGKNKI